MPRPLNPQSGRSNPRVSASGTLDANTAPVPASLSKLQQENARLQAELDRLRKSEMPAPSMNSRSVMWMACGLCGIALLFALAALFRR